MTFTEELKLIELESGFYQVNSLALCLPFSDERQLVQAHHAASQVSKGLLARVPAHIPPLVLERPGTDALEIICYCAHVPEAVALAAEILRATGITGFRIGARDAARGCWIVVHPSPGAPWPFVQEVPTLPFDLLSKKVALDDSHSAIDVREEEIVRQHAAGELNGEAYEGAIASLAERRELACAMLDDLRAMMAALRRTLEGEKS